MCCLVPLVALAPVSSPAAAAEYDIVVYGGTASGTSAAVLGARMKE